MSFLSRLMGRPEPYQKVYQPYWETVSIYDGGAVFLRDLEAVPEAVRPLLVTHWLQSEVNNGGFEQFFMNSTGVLAPEAAQGFVAIAMPRAGAVVAELVAAFGPEYPRDKEARNDWLAAHEDAFYAQFPDENAADLSLAGPLLNLPNALFWKLLKEEGGGYLASANRYAEGLSA